MTTKLPTILTDHQSGFLHILKKPAAFQLSEHIRDFESKKKSKPWKDCKRQLIFFRHKCNNFLSFALLGVKGMLCIWIKQMLKKNNPSPLLAIF